jgi:hypothetical protein
LSALISQVILPQNHWVFLWNFKILLILLEKAVISWIISKPLRIPLEDSGGFWVHSSYNEDFRMPSFEQKAVMLSPVSFCLLIRAGIFDSFIIFYVLVEKYSAATTEKRCTTPDDYISVIDLVFCIG